MSTHTGLGCSFLNQRCTNKTIYPYLCDVTTEQEICTYDHLSKVRTYVQIYVNTLYVLETNLKGRCERSWRGFNGCPVAVADDNSDFCRYNEHSSVSEIRNYSQFYNV